jgi:Leucine-rich repeat (LRR) protein
MKNNTYIAIVVAFLVGAAFVIVNRSNILAINGRGTNDRNANVTKVTDATVLDLSNRGLDKIPSDVFDQTNLQDLNISNNKLTGAIPSQLGQLKNLKILNASNNQMTGLPAEVGQLVNLQVLNLANNKLTGLPNELAKLTKLQTLDLRGNSYSKQDLDLIRKSLINTNILVDGGKPAASGSVTGHVLLGPTCPVQRNPPDPNCADKPYQTTVQVLSARNVGGATFSTIETDKNGVFKITLPPGDYTLSAANGKIFPRCTAVNMVVKAGQVSEINLNCDTGIR